MSSSFEKAVRATQCLAAAYCQGLQAIPNKDRRRITCRKGHRVTGSIDVDHALLASHPEANRWDYGIGVKAKSEYVVWVEIHPASSSHVQEVIDKLQWLRNWLVSEAPALHQLTAAFVWVASGKVTLTPNSPQRRRIAQTGIHFAGQRVQVDTL